MSEKRSPYLIRSRRNMPTEDGSASTQQQSVSMSSSNIPHPAVTIFKGTDYNTWKFRIIRHLKGRQLHNIIKEVKEDDEEWKIQDDICQSVIISYIGDEVIEHIKDASSAKEIIEALDKQYEKIPRSSQVSLVRELLSMRFDEKEDIEGFLKRFEEKIHRLKSAGRQVKDQGIVDYFLNTLPVSFGPFLTVLDNISDAECTWEEVKVRVRQECARRKLANGTDVKNGDSVNVPTTSSEVKENATALSAEFRGKSNGGQRGHHGHRQNPNSKRNGNRSCNKNDNNNRSNGNRQYNSNNVRYNNGNRNFSNRRGRGNFRKQYGNRNNLQCYRCGKDGH